MDQDKAQQHELLLRKWIHEDELINHRLTWLMVSQTLLFTAYAALYYADATAEAQCPGKATILKSKIEFSIFLLPWIGAFVSILIWTAVIAAIRALYILKDLHDKAIIIPPESQHEHYGYHRLGISDRTIILGLAPCLIPFIFFLVWLLLIVSNYRYG